MSYHVDEDGNAERDDDDEPVYGIRADALMGDGRVQTATGIDPRSGDTVVLLRIGLVVHALTVESAKALGDALLDESAYAHATRAERAIVQ